MAARSAHPERLHNLVRLIEDEMGYELYQRVCVGGRGLALIGRDRLAD